MASAMTPILSQYWDEGGKKARERIGLDPDQWQVTDPNLKAKIEAAALQFCGRTNQTTSLQLDKALARLREELTAGLVEHGESIPQLTKRVRAVFEHASEHRARRIATTEAARAVHAAQEQSAIESGVVAGFEWLASEDACPLCLQIAAEVKQVPLGGKFAEVGTHPLYSRIGFPPAHPHCQCTVIEVLMPGYGGPEAPEWGTPLDQPDPPGDYTPPVPVTPEPEKLEPKPKPAPEPEPKPETPLERHKRLIAEAEARQGGRVPDGPIAGRIARDEVAEAKRQALIELERGRQETARVAMADHEAAVGDNRRAQILEDEGALLAAKGQAAAAGRKFAEAKRLKADASKRMLAATLRTREAAEAYRANLYAILDAKDRQPAILDERGATIPDTLREPLREAATFLGRVVEGGIPRVFVRVLGPGERPFYRDAERAMYVEPRESAALVVHEAIHGYDYNGTLADGRPVLERTYEFYNYRTAGKPLVKLNDVVPGANYKDHEQARDGGFVAALGGNSGWYAGRDYGSDADRQGREVLTMGVQKLYEDPLSLAEKDPEYFRFVVGILGGTLR
jgi:SPP1 gp7 family putative phage head morphogenesis protein